MYVKHSLSTSDSDRQINPAGKFREALTELISFARQTPSIDQNTLGFQGFLACYNDPSNPFPGFGIPKKLSMMHHMETLSNYLS
jgi:hypothetical protein